MPDWIAHLCFAYLISRGLKIKEKNPLLVGAILPDLWKLHEPLSALLGYLVAINLFAPFHTIVGIFLSAALISGFFRNAYSSILIGAFSHLLLDSFLHPYGAKIWFFWPFWIGYRDYGFIWSDSYLPALILSFVFLILWVSKNYKGL